MNENVIYEYFDTGEVFRKLYYIDQKLHKENGPAITEFSKDGKINIEAYFINDNYHRKNGPAVVLYYSNERIEYSFWFFNAKEYSEEVNNWLITNNLHWKTMSADDFNRMWMELL